MLNFTCTVFYTDIQVSLMGINTVVGFICKYLMYDVEQVAKDYVWFAFPVVVIMAPVGIKRKHKTTYNSPSVCV